MQSITVSAASVEITHWGPEGGIMNIDAFISGGGRAKVTMHGHTPIRGNMRTTMTLTCDEAMARILRGVSVDAPLTVRSEDHLFSDAVMTGLSEISITGENRGRLLEPRTLQREELFSHRDINPNVLGRELLDGISGGVTFETLRDVFNNTIILEVKASPEKVPQIVQNYLANRGRIPLWLTVTINGQPAAAGASGGLADNVAVSDPNSIDRRGRRVLRVGDDYRKT